MLHRLCVSRHTAPCKYAVKEDEDYIVKKSAQLPKQGYLHKGFCSNWSGNIGATCSGSAKDPNKGDEEHVSKDLSQDYMNNLQDQD